MRPINEFIEQLDENRWLIGGKLVLTRGISEHLSSWKDEDTGLFYGISENTSEVPDPKPLSSEGDVKIVYEAGRSSAVWSIGSGAFCKIKELLPKATSEHATLQFLHQHRLSFSIPKVHFYIEQDGYSFLFLSRLPGRTLTEAWPTLEQRWREHYVSSIARICKELSLWESDQITGVDGNHLSEYYLDKNSARLFSAKDLEENCKDIGMNCSSFKFFHCDLGPGNIIVEMEPSDGDIGIIDWEIAGYVPLEWIRTKFRLSSGMDLPNHNGEWRKLVQLQLGTDGFPEIVGKWWDWKNKTS